MRQLAKALLFTAIATAAICCVQPGHGTEGELDATSPPAVDARPVDAAPTDYTGTPCDYSENPRYGCHFGWCCHATSQVCVPGIVNGPGDTGPLCYADTGVQQPPLACDGYDGLDFGACTGPADCHLPGYPDGGPGDGLCCDERIGRCVRGIDRDTQGYRYPSCYARTDFDLPPAACAP